MTVLEPIDPTDDAAFAEFHATYVAAHVDQWERPYDAREMRAQLLDDAGFVRQVPLLARDEAGVPVGVATAELPLMDNRTLLYFDLRVRPEFRRQGHGSALLDCLTDVARTHDRTTLFGEAVWAVGSEGSAHTAFAEASGFERDMVDAHRVLDLPATLPAAPVRDGYMLRTWRGPCPDEWIDAYANLLSLITQEAPSGDLQFENEFYDAKRVRAEEQVLVRQGRIMQVVLALAPDGVVAGHTQLCFPGGSQPYVFQWDTLVLPAHRGHGLGLSLKVFAMEASQDLQEGRTLVHTYNAASNGPMITVNEALGFRQIAWVGEYVREL